MPEMYNVSSGDILIVDDTPENLTMLKGILVEEGYQVRPALNGQIALRTIEYVVPDLILLDVMMPGMDGYEVCQRVKANPRTQDVPVIFISAHHETLNKVRAFEVGGIDYITNPFETAEVLARIRIHIRLRHIQKQMTEQHKQLEQEIIEHKRTKEELRHLNTKLEQRVKQRTLELERANQELQHFTYAASHDLKTPLRGINQLATWLKNDYEDLLDQKGQEMIALLIQRVRRLDAVIEGVIHYAAIGPVPVQTEQVDMEMLCKNVLSSLHLPAAIHVRIESPLPSIAADSASLEKVWYHLLRNAKESMDSSGGEIVVSACQEGEQWTFSVTDTGPGIEKKYHKKIFQIFQTLAPHNEHEHPGVGLSLVKKIVELYGGRVWVESTPGKGSTFSFTFPE